MKQNQMILMGAIAFVIVVGALAVAYANKVKPDTKALDIKVYKSHIDDSYESGHVYRECNIDSGVLAELVQEFNKSYKLSDSQMVSNKSINGTYKLIYNNKFVAFDNADDNIIYLGSKDALYTFKSSIYQKVIDYCG